MRSLVIAAVLAVAVAVALAAAAPASGSQIIGRNATNVKLKVDAKGRALVTFRDAKGVKRVLAWGAVNDDVRFKLDYSGGYGAFKKPLWKTFKDASRPYDGPPLKWLVTARKARDGSYWAIQSWQRMLPNYGYTPWRASQKVWELHLSHWRGPVPKLEIWLDWVYRGKFHHLFGRYTYRGKPVFGYAHTPTGVPLDPYGRNVYVDTLGSAYGPGWKREMSFLTHRPNGNFCYGFYPRRSVYDGSQRPAGHGSRYRATIIGPGVTPDAYWEAAGLGAYDPALDAEMNAVGVKIANGDSACQKP
jgi:hypothetical protein